MALASNKPQTIIWTNADSIDWRIIKYFCFFLHILCFISTNTLEWSNYNFSNPHIYATPGGDELK